MECKRLELVKAGEMFKPIQNHSVMPYCFMKTSNEQLYGYHDCINLETGRVERIHQNAVVKLIHEIHIKRTNDSEVNNIVGLEEMKDEVYTD